MQSASDRKQPAPGLLQLLWRQMGSGRTTPSQHVVQYALGALHALQATGQLDDKNAAVWHKRFQGGLGTSSLHVPTAAAVSDLESSAEQTGISENETEADDFDESTFVASVAGPDRHVETKAGRLRITGIEMYERGLLVHWLFRLAPYLQAFGKASRSPVPSDDQQRAERVIFEAIPHFRVKDTVGTQYIEAQSLWVGTGTLHGDARFLPGVSPLASGLEFEGPGWHLKLEFLPRKP